MNRIIESSSFKEFCTTACCKLSDSNSTEVFNALVAEILDLNCSITSPIMRSIVLSRTKVGLSVLREREREKNKSTPILLLIEELISLINTQIEIVKIEMTQPKDNRYVKAVKPSALHWTASSAEFIELSKALFLANCFNEGEITFKDLFEILTTSFNIQIQHPHTAYTKMKERVEDRTLFLSKLKEVVEKDMDRKDYK